MPEQIPYVPSSTYRVQLHKGFPFARLREILPYLYELGISHVYASPVTTAVAGSNHGYDVTDPLTLNPEIGTMTEWESITEWLHAHGMGWIQDIVPNHMAFSTENEWLYDVLERGSVSEFYSFFDIIPQTAGGGETGTLYAEKIMVPFLGEPVEAAVEAGDLRLVFGPEGFGFQYHDQLYPAAAGSYAWICSVLPGLHQPLLAWAEKTASFGYLNYALWRSFKARHLAAAAQNERIGERIRASVAHINEQKTLLLQLLNAQPYRLCSWEASFRQMNYRRFFAVNALICLRMEDDAVFRRWHPRQLAWFRAGLIQGFRIDHIDGLADPGEYLHRLRRETGPEAYIVTEKILQENEVTLAEWPVQGTSGYEFLSFVNQLLTDLPGRKELLHWYQKNILDTPYPELVYEKKASFLASHLQGEMKNLLRGLLELPAVKAANLPAGAWKEALSALMAAFPVYRIYPQGFPLSPTDRAYLETAFARAEKQAAGPALDRLKALFFGTEQSGAGPAGDEPDKDDKVVAAYLQRWSQFTGPLAAKGTEDTVFYVDNFLISLNEVGDAPGNEPVTANSFHELMRWRQKNQPLSMNGTSTHDTKRGEDGRMRISQLTRQPARWLALVENWQRETDQLPRTPAGKRSPSKNDEYLIYQALLGALPADGRISLDFRKRFDAYLQKALREEKMETNWETPDLDYEKGVFDFVHRLLDPAGSFLPVFLPFAKDLAQQARATSLAQTLLKLTAPGIPDIYQGAETWDLSLVDPDNRLPVDFPKRQEMLAAMAGADQGAWTEVLSYVHAHAAEGAEKLWLIRQVLRFRRRNSRLFAAGEYVPFLATTGHLGYLRVHGESAAAVVVTLPGAPEPVPAVPFPGPAGSWHSLLTGEARVFGDIFDPLTLTGEFPVACWVRDDEQ